MLWLIWSISIVLSVLSLLVMGILILRRLLKQRRKAAEAQARQTVLRALITFSHDRDRQVLKQVVAGVPPRVALDAGFEFLALLRGDEHDAVIALFAECDLPAEAGRQLRKGNAAARIHAAEMLAKFKSNDTAGALQTALERDRSREVRLAAAIALCDLDALPPLDVVLRQIGLTGQRSRRLVDLFRRLPADRFDELKAHIARPDTTTFVKSAAIEALARTGDHRLNDLFQQAAKEAIPDVAAAAVRALGLLGHPDAVPVLTEAMAHGDWSVRAEAAEAAGRLGLPDFVAPLLVLLDDDIWMVSYTAAKAMRGIPPLGEDRLREVAAGETSLRQRIASLVLAEGPA
ncbi:HEAT repeat domain-containing protein [Labrys sp. 22185]|uniref:HEAT repeat domain-containing protein n=1 Tax=Labrys sp. 22185 TaxID=3453888 RepID=UPI003F827D64